MTAASSTVSAGSNAACRLQIENLCPYRAATSMSAQFMCSVHIRKNVLLCINLAVFVPVCVCVQLLEAPHDPASDCLNTPVQDLESIPRGCKLQCPELCRVCFFFI